MPSARPRKIGRNESCPCGSGHKYKRCCLAKDEQAARDAPPPGRAAPLDPKGLAREMMAAMHNLTEMQAQELARRLAGLVRPGGRLQVLRFSPQSLADAVTRHIDAFEATHVAGVDAEGRQPHELLCDLCWPDLSRSDFLDRARRACATLMEETTVEPAVRQAAAFGLFSSLADQLDAYPPLLAQLIFGGQLATLRGANPAVDRALAILVPGPAPGLLETAVASARSDVSARHDRRQQELERQMLAGVDEAAAWLMGPGAPALLTGDQVVGLMGIFAQADQGSAPAGAAWADRAVQQLDRLGVPAALQAATAAGDTSTSTASAMWRARSAAVRVAPLKLAASLLQNPSLALVLRADDERTLVEAATADGARGAAGRQAYAGWLVDRGETRAADRVREAGPALDALGTEP